MTKSKSKKPKKSNNVPRITIDKAEREKQIAVLNERTLCDRRIAELREAHKKHLEQAAAGFQTSMDSFNAQLRNKASEVRVTVAEEAAVQAANLLLERCDDAGVNIRNALTMDNVGFKAHVDGTISIFFKDRHASAIRVPLAFLAGNETNNVSFALGYLRTFEKAERLGIKFVVRNEPFKSQP